MAKPRELYSGPAPERTFAQMGAGIADAYANVGRIEGQGMQALGQGIAQGITAAAGAISDYKKMQSQIKSSEGFYNTLKEGGYLPPELAKGIDATVNSEVYKNMGTAEKAQFWNQATNFTGNAIGQFYRMQQIEAEQGGALQRAQIGVGPQYAQLEEQRRQREQDARNREATNQKIEGFGKSLEKFRGMFGGG